MSALGDNFAFIQNDNFVGVDHRADALCDDEGRASPHESIECFLDLRLRIEVNTGGRVIQDENARVEEQGAGNSNALLLSAGERGTAFPDMCVIAIGERQYEVVCLSSFRSGFDLCLRSIRFTESDVLTDRAAEQRCFL